MTEKTVLNVLGMSCAHCERAVVNALSDLVGVLSVQVELKENTVTVEYDKSAVSLETIKAEIVDCGYEVK